MNIYKIGLFLLIIFIFTYISKSNKKNIINEIYLISLDKDYERRENVLKNINVNYIYAFDGNTLDKNKLIKDGLLTNNNLKKGEIGVYFSHLHMILEAIRKKQNILILEDDIEIEENKLENIKLAVNQAPEDFQLLFVSYNYYENYDYNKINLVHGMQAYVVNGKNITEEEVYHKLFPIEKPIDVIIPSKFISYIVKPKICELNSNFALISNTQGID